MMVVTSDQIAGQRIVRALGLARGSTIRARHVGRDFMALLRNLVGGEVTEYTRLMAEAREDPDMSGRMIEDAQRMGANAVVGTRFATAMIMSGAAEMLAYGTAVVVE